MATVVDAHIATLHVIVRDHTQGHGGELGLSLAASLDKAIAKFHLTSSSDRDGLREEVARSSRKNNAARLAPARPMEQNAARRRVWSITGGRQWKPYQRAQTSFARKCCGRSACISPAIP
jgi:hypothetical protein